MTIRVVRLGSPRSRGEGTRVGTVRRPPRGVPKSRFASEDWYDVWLPVLSPSAGLVKQALAAQQDRTPAGDKVWAKFVRGYRSEMREPQAAHLLDLLAALSHGADFSVGCYCEDESRCHRSVLRELLLERRAEVVPRAS
jgi:uncharacterized protein YeaO (DUF488 family)